MFQPHLTIRAASILSDGSSTSGNFWKEMAFIFGNGPWFMEYGGLTWLTLSGRVNHLTHRKNRKEKEGIMKEGTRNQLEAKLKKMLNDLDHAKDREEKTISQLGTGNIIRRRKGERDKRFSNCREPELCADAAV